MRKDNKGQRFQRPGKPGAAPEGARHAATRQGPRGDARPKRDGRDGDAPKTSAGYSGHKKAGDSKTRFGKPGFGKPSFDKARPERARPDNVRPDKARPDKAGPGHVSPGRSHDGKPRAAKAIPAWARPDRANSDKTRPDKARPDGARPGKPRFDKPRFDKGGGEPGKFGAARPERGRPDRVRTDRPVHERNRPERVRPDRRPPRDAKPAEVEGGAPSEPMRIAKAMARAGLCSRREAERWIAEGRVSVNGKVLATPATEVGPKDRVLVDGEPLPEQDPIRMWRYYKPRGLVTTHSDPEGRPTVFDNLPAELPRVISVGRLDFNTEGLLLLTNDGQLARHLELPTTGWLRRYRVRARGRVNQAQLDGLKEGISLEGINYGPVEATLDSTQGQNMWLTVGLREGKNREIRKIMGHLGLEVSRLIRISFGPFQIMELEPGEIAPVRRRVLREQLGPHIAREMGLMEGTEAQDELDGKPAHTGKRKAKPGTWTP